MTSKRSTIRSTALAVALTFASWPILGAGPTSGIDVRVINAPLPIQGTVSVSNLPAPVQSQLVALRGPLATEGACPSLAALSLNFNTILNSDGSSGAFTIPAGTVLVITAVDVFGFGVGANASIQTRLFRGGSAGMDIVARRESEANAAGRIYHRYEFPSGLEVNSAGRVCVNANDNDLGFSGFLYGYLKPAS